MAINKRPPNTIHLSGIITYEEKYNAVEELLPGMLLEPHVSSGSRAYGVQDSADAAIPEVIFALERGEMNKTYADPYVAGDLVKVGYPVNGTGIWAILPAGQTIVVGDLLQSNGDGRLKILGAGTAIARAEEGTGGATSGANTYIRIVCL